MDDALSLVDQTPSMDLQNELTADFEASMFLPAFKEASIDLFELGIDSFLENDLLKEVPIVRTVLGLGTTAKNIHERHLICNTAAFLHELSNAEIPTEKAKRYRKKLRDDPALREKELGRVLILLDRNIDSIKSVLDAKFFAAYINEQIGWDEFCELSDITDRLFVADLSTMQEAHLNGGVAIQMPLSYRHERLISTGLLTNRVSLSGSVAAIDFDSQEPRIVIELTDIGALFGDIAFGLPARGKVVS